MGIQRTMYYPDYGYHTYITSTSDGHEEGKEEEVERNEEQITSYSSSGGRYRRECVMRVLILLLTACSLAFVGTSHGVSIIWCYSNGKDRTYYHMWYDKHVTHTDFMTSTYMNLSLGPVRIISFITMILGSLFLIAAFVLSVLFVRWRIVSETQRRDDDEEKPHVLAHRQHQQHQQHQRRANGIQEYHQYYYSREYHRRRRDRKLGLALFILLVLAAATSMVTIICFERYFNDTLSRVQCYGEYYSAGFWLLIVATITSTVAFVVLSMPQCSGLWLCYGPPVEDMPEDEASPGEEEGGAEEMAMHYPEAQPGLPVSTFQRLLEGTVVVPTELLEDAPGARGGEEEVVPAPAGPPAATVEAAAAQAAEHSGNPLQNSTGTLSDSNLNASGGAVMDLQAKKTKAAAAVKGENESMTGDGSANKAAKEGKDKDHE